MSNPPLMCQAMTIEQLFTGKQFRLDYYQREYVWSRNHVQVLLIDLLRKFQPSWERNPDVRQASRFPPYSLGSIVYFVEGEITYLVDGQQRVTTLHLLLIHLRRLLKEQASTTSDPDDYASGLDRFVWSRRHRNTFTVDIDDRNPLLRAIAAGSPYDLLPDASPSVRNLYERNADIEADFPTELADDALRSFTDWLLESVYVVGIQAHNREHGWEIFETTNARGVRLGPVDLLKSFILSRAAEGHADLNRGWRDMLAELALLGADVPSEFLKDVLLAKYVDVASERDLADVGAVHEWIRANASSRMGLRLGRDFETFTTNLLIPTAQRYCEVRRAAEAYSDHLPAVYFNARNQVPHHEAAVLAAVREGDTNDVFASKARLVSAYLDLLFVRRLVNGKLTQAAELSDDILALITRLRDCHTADEVGHLLGTEIAQLDDTFAAVTTYGLTTTNGRQVRYVLSRLTAFCDVGAGMRNPIAEYLDPTRPYEIEHIWADHFDRYEGEVKTQQAFHSWRNRLGALLLLDRSHNAAFRDDPYRRKVEHYLRHNVLAASLHPTFYERNPAFVRFLKSTKLVSYFVPHPSDFDRAAIEQRQTLFRHLCEIVWDPALHGFEVPKMRTPARKRKTRTRAHYRVKLPQLIEAGFIKPDERIAGFRGGVEYEAFVELDGRIRLATGELYADLSPAGSAALRTKACAGWDFWHVDREGVPVSLAKLRNDALKQGALERT